jgi:hypothetical protein
MHRLALSFAAALAVLAPAPAASPNPKDLAIPPAELARAKELVKKLASEEFEEREEAQETLEKMGRLAMPALLEGLNTNPSPEVRSRCLALVPKAAQEDLNARLETFLADTEGKYDHDLGGWNEFRKIAGNSSASRATFVELLKEPVNRSLVLAVGGSPQELGRLVAARKNEIYQMRFPRTANAPRKEQTVQDVLALMFAESHVAAKYVPRTVTTTTIYNVAGLTNAITGNEERGPIYKSIIGNWIETRDDAVSMYTAMNQATAFGLPKQGAAVAGKLVQMKNGTLIYRFYAAFAIARTGAKDQLPVLESVFDDETALNQVRIVNNQQQALQLQMRDMALAAALLLTGQKAEEYGFIENYKNQAGMQFTYSNWRLPEEKRKEAFEKWKAWREKNKDFGKDGK